MPPLEHLALNPCNPGDDSCYDLLELEDLMAFPIPYVPDTSLEYIEPENILSQTVWPIDYYDPTTVRSVGDEVLNAFEQNAQADSEVGA